MPISLAAVPALVNGAPVFLGVTDVTTTAKTNAEATTPYGTTGLTDKALLIQASAECYVGVTATSTGDVTTANGVKLAADERVIVLMSATYPYLVAITASGTANLRVWELV